MNENTEYQQPAWWSDRHTSAWERVKTAFKRDWEQTKADVSSGGRELEQNAADTVKQAVGAEEPPPATVPNPKPEFTDVEKAARFGFGARTQYRDYNDWNDTLEAKLRTDWDAMKPGRSFEDSRGYIRSGWELADEEPGKLSH